MRAWAGFTVVVAFAVGSVGGTAGAASARPSGRPDDPIPTVRMHPVSERHPDCHFTTVKVDKPVPRRRGHPAPTGVGASTAANVTVEIPPVVLVHRRGRGLDVFTNTGSRPQVGDEFYAVNQRRDAPADAALAREVIEWCSTSQRPTGPG